MRGPRRGEKEIQREQGRRRKESGSGCGLATARKTLVLNEFFTYYTFPDSLLISAEFTHPRLSPKFCLTSLAEARNENVAHMSSFQAHLPIVADTFLIFAKHRRDNYAPRNHYCITPRKPKPADYYIS